jgi:hypothetical protein
MEKLNQLSPAQTLPQNRLPAAIDPVNPRHILGNIQPNDTDSLGHRPPPANTVAVLPTEAGSVLSGQQLSCQDGQHITLTRSLMGLDSAGTRLVFGLRIWGAHH